MKRQKREVGVEIRGMELSDLSAVFALGQKLFTAEKWPTLYRAWDEYEVVQLFRSDGDYCFVADADGVVVGFALGTVMEKYRSAWRYGWLLWLGVNPRYKRRGIASRLLNRLTEAFLEREVRIMLVDTDEENTDAIQFFTKNGFDNAIRHVYLSANLDEAMRTRERSLRPKD